MKLGTFTVSRSEIDDKAAKSRAQHAKPECKYRIDGAYYSLGEIAKELGIGASTAGSRVRKLARASGAITFQRLRDMGA